MSSPSKPFDINSITTESVKQMAEKHAVDTARHKKELKSKIEQELEASLPPKPPKPPGKAALNAGLKAMGEKEERKHADRKRSKIRKLRLYQAHFSEHCPKGSEKINEKAPEEEIDSVLKGIQDSIQLKNLDASVKSFFFGGAEFVEKAWCAYSPLNDKILLQGFGAAVRHPEMRKKYNLDATILQLGIEHHEFFTRSVYWNFGSALAQIAREVHFQNLMRRMQLDKAGVSEDLSRGAADL